MTHRLQLFDTPESLAESVATFLHEGYLAGDNLLVAAKRKNLDAILHAMHDKGCFRSLGDDKQRVVALDATEIRRLLLRNGQVDPERFESEVASVVSRLASSGRLRVYGEIVEVFAEEGDFSGALRLEQLWNGLSHRYPFTLMCGYSSAHFAGARHELRNICSAHDHVCAGVDDTLGSYLLTTA